MVNSNKTTSKIIDSDRTEETQPKQHQEKLEQSEGSTPLSPIDRANQAYKLVYGETAKIPIQHESIATAQDADWFVRSYMGSLFAKPNDNPLTQKFSNLEELLTWFDQIYLLQQQEEESE